MARSGLNSNAHLTIVNPGDARSNESQQWNLVRSGLLAQIQQGIVVASAWGSRLPTRSLPIVGTETTSTHEEGYKPDLIHTSYFEQPLLKTVGSATASDKYVLHVRFALANLTTYSVGAGGTSGTATIGGKIKIELSNSGGTQVLYDAHSSASGSGLSNNSFTPGPGTIAHYEAVSTGTVSASLLPNPGTTRDSKVIVTLSNTITSESGLTVTGQYTMNTFPSTGDYIGVFGYSLKLYNDGQ